MRKATAFIAGFAAVLIAGAAIAQSGLLPAADQPISEPSLQAAEEPTEPVVKTAAKAAATAEVEKPVAEKPAAKEVVEPTKTEAPAEEKPPVEEKPAAEEKPVADEKPPAEEKPVAEEKPADTTPPPIAIISPTQGQVFETKTVRFSGETEPGAKVFAGDYQADVDATGKWSIVLVLQPGGNVATFKAIDAAGNYAKASVKVFWETGEVQEKDWYFSAKQQYGSCGEDVPYDVFWGTGKPGSWIHIVSEFGAAEAKIGEKGHWEAKVLFPKAPVGKTFLVKVKDAFGNVAKFEFTRTG